MLALRRISDIRAWLLVAGLVLSSSAIAASPIAFKLSAGKITGSVEAVPLTRALDALRRAGARFDYRVVEVLRDAPVSGLFKEVRLRDALRRLLEPYNYYATGPEGRIDRLWVTSRKRGQAIVASKLRNTVRSAPATEPRVVLSDGRTLAELSDAEKRFIAGIAHGEPPADDQYEMFYPEQPLGSEWMGPGALDDAESTDTPAAADPLVNLDGPPVPDGTPVAGSPEFGFEGQSSDGPMPPAP